MPEPEKSEEFTIITKTKAGKTKIITGNVGKSLKKKDGEDSEILNIKSKATSIPNMLVDQKLPEASPKQSP